MYNSWNHHYNQDSEHIHQNPKCLCSSLWVFLAVSHDPPFPSPAFCPHRLSKPKDQTVVKVVDLKIIFCADFSKRKMDFAIDFVGSFKSDFKHTGNMFKQSLIKQVIQRVYVVL